MKLIAKAKKMKKKYKKNFATSINISTKARNSGPMVGLACMKDRLWIKARSTPTEMKPSEINRPLWGGCLTNPSDVLMPSFKIVSAVVHQMT